MELKKLFYTMPKDEFNVYINNLKINPDTISFFKDTSKSYFYAPDININKSLLVLNKLQWEFDMIFNSFSEFGKKQLIQSFLLDEIEATNKIENIHSTRHDIFYILNKTKNSKDKKIISITNTYNLLLNSSCLDIKELKDIRSVYDSIMLNAYDNDDDKPDGTYFRKNSVNIINGLKVIHQGFEGEELINKAMEETLTFYNSDYPVYEKMIIFHFLLETIHPFYDGNGRLGRFLFTNGLFKETNSYSSFIIAKAFLNCRNKYYSSLKNPDLIYEHNCLNDYVISLINILSDQLSLTIADLKQKQKQISEIYINKNLTKQQKKIYHLIKEASIISEFGISNNEIIEELKISKRNLIYALNNFRKNNLITETKIGRTTFHKIK